MLGILLLAIPAVHARIWYVNAGAPPAGDGRAWATAYVDVQQVFDNAQFAPQVDEIWVAAGTYKPTVRVGGPSDRYRSYALPAFTRMYGGFAGHETRRDQRNPERNETILSGDIGVEGSANDDCHHVVSILHEAYPQVFSGFTVTAGNADGAPDLTAIVGAGITVGRPTPIGGRASVQITRCRFTGNRSLGGGAGIFLHAGQVEIVSCDFSSNHGNAGSGAVEVTSNHSEDGCHFANCVFRDNSGGRGGAVYVTTPIRSAFTNCTFQGNVSSNPGGAVRLDLRGLDGGARAHFRNCIFWSNSPDQIADTSAIGIRIVEYSDIQGGWSGAGTNNLDVDPLFGDPAEWRLKLQNGSPCIDAGDDLAVPGDFADLDDDGIIEEPLPWDRSGFLRQYDSIVGAALVDLGAYENAHLQDCIFDLTNDGMIDLADLAILLSCFGQPADGLCSPADLDGDDFVALEDLAELLGAFGEECR